MSADVSELVTYIVALFDQPAVQPLLPELHFPLLGSDAHPNDLLVLLYRHHYEIEKQVVHKEMTD